MGGRAEEFGQAAHAAGAAGRSGRALPPRTRAGTLGQGARRPRFIAPRAAKARRGDRGIRSSARAGSGVR